MLWFLDMHVPGLHMTIKLSSRGALLVDTLCVVLCGSPLLFMLSLCYLMILFPADEHGREPDAVRQGDGNRGRRVVEAQYSNVIRYLFPPGSRCDIIINGSNS